LISPGEPEVMEEEKFDARQERRDRKLKEKREHMQKHGVV